MAKMEKKPLNIDGASEAFVRPSTEADIKAMRDIYAYHVLHGLGTFEETPPSEEELASRRCKVLAMNLPWLVAEVDGRVAGYCYAAEYRSRPAYRYTVENSVYVLEKLRGRGIGTALLGELLARCEAGPWRQMVAVIGDSGNAASIAMHRRWDFQMVGTMRSVGLKLGRWVDTVIMQRALGPGDSETPV